MSKAFRGFTLSELLIALTILAVVLTGSLAVFINCILMNEATRNLNIAISHAEFVMEDIKNTIFTNIVTKIDNKYWDWNSATIAFYGLTPLSNESINTSRGTNTSLLNISVRVDWKDRGVRVRNISIGTLLASP